MTLPAGGGVVALAAHAPKRTPAFQRYWEANEHDRPPVGPHISIQRSRAERYFDPTKDELLPPAQATVALQ